MIDILDSSPDVNVPPEEYVRLLGYPRGHSLDGIAHERAEQARAWYRANGRPWVYARRCESIHLMTDSVLIDDVPFRSKRLRTTLLDSSADKLVLVAVSAGPEIENAAALAWRESKPDEYFFLEVFGSAVVEHLVTTTGARLCAWAEQNGMAVLPHYSPGYADWDVAQQPQLLDLIRRGARNALPGPLQALESGMLRPKKSLLAMFGLTRQVARVKRLTDLVPCQNCSFAPCQYRRAPYRHFPGSTEVEIAVGIEPQAEPPAALDRSARYLANNKALARWSAERLLLQHRPDGSVDALFRYDGTTCSNMGRTLAFEYRVKLSGRDEAYVIRDLACAPVAGDDGHRHMCAYLTDPAQLMSAIEREKPPLVGRPLNDVLTWTRPAIGPGCYCEAASRLHKWGLVLETIHYALAQSEREREREREQEPTGAADERVIASMERSR